MCLLVKAKAVRFLDIFRSQDLFAVYRILMLSLPLFLSSQCVVSWFTNVAMSSSLSPAQVLIKGPRQT